MLVYMPHDRHTQAKISALRGCTNACAMQSLMKAHLFATQANGLVEQLGHLLVVGVILPSGPAGNEPIVFQLVDVLVREPLQFRQSSVGQASDTTRRAR